MAEESERVVNAVVSLALQAVKDVETDENGTYVLYRTKNGLNGPHLSKVKRHARFVGVRQQSFILD